MCTYLYLFEYEYARSYTMATYSPDAISLRFAIRVYSFVFTTRAGDIVIKYTYYKMCDPLQYLQV